MYRLTICILPLLALHSLGVQGLDPTRRAAYEFQFGRAWSASVDLPQYGLLDLSQRIVPLSVNDAGIVLLRNSAAQLVRWTWGRRQVLAEFQPLDLTTLMNGKGTAVTIRDREPWEPDVQFWYPGDGAPRLLEWGDNLIARPYYANILALNDRDELILEAKAFKGESERDLLHTETNKVDLVSGSFEEWTLYAYDLPRHGDLVQGGLTYKVSGFNNYGDSVGQVYEDSAVSGESGLTYQYQNEFYAQNLTRVLDFEPWAINDSGTILGQTAAPQQGLVILDAFGQRPVGPVLAELNSIRPCMSNPSNGLEEIVVGPHYFKRMSERNFLGQSTGTPSPDFWHGRIGDLVSHRDPWRMLEATAISANGRIAGTGWVYHPETGDYQRHGFLLQHTNLVPDWNRDGQIDAFDRDYSHQGQPWRMWINDDDDFGDDYRSYVDDLPGGDNPDWTNPGMDGLRDGVDFFPLLIDLHAELKALGDLSQLEIRLSQADAALNFTYTSLLPEETWRLVETAPDTGFGPDMDEPFGDCRTERVTAAGVSLSPAFLKAIRDSNRAVILLEGTRASTEPLVLELIHAGETVTSSSLPLSISPVVDMLRIINLRQADPKFSGSDPGPWNTRTGNPPNLPDRFLESLTRPLRTLVHIHGFNWGGDEIPAAHAELFKRLYQSGSNARYLGIIWYGDEGTLDLTGNSLTYNENVINAFITAGYMADALLPFSGSATYALAHSLGNMLTSSAIVDHGLRLGHYFMVNAAVPLESYSGEAEDRRLMVHPDWKDEPGLVPDYAEHLLSANWSRFFPGEDNRSLLSWKDRFASVADLVPCTNFFSSGEDVLRSGNGDLPALFGDVGDQELVWVYNEMIKGTNEITAPISTDVHGGWGFNRTYMDWVDPGGPAHPPSGSWERISPAEADTIDPAGLMAEPFFRPFDTADTDFPGWGDGSWLYGSTTGANARLPGVPLSDSDPDRIKNHAKILGEAIPGHSAPTGSQPVSRLFLMDNVNLDQVCRSQSLWPERESTDKRDRWLHSDFIRPSLPHVFRFFRHCIRTINFMP